ncbi:MAG: hypothetical protein SA339_00960 [Methanomassiliicoccus sp.]|nr:hypothetical protein [Methanomassiliicoccus sp.]
MEPTAILRRIVHLSTPVFLVYYILPSPLWPGGPQKEAVLLLALAATLIFEAARLALGIRVPGMRPYEADQISAAAWAGIALTFSFLFFPLELTAPVIFGMAWVDPVIGVVRRSKWYPWLPYALHLTIMMAVLALLVPLDLQWGVAAAVTSAVAIAAEGIKTSYVDDDILMIVVPLLALFILTGV